MRSAQLLPLLSLLLLPSLARGQSTPEEIIERFRPNRMVWHLEATISRQGTAHGETSSKDGLKRRSNQRAVSDVATVHACGQLGVWAVSGVDWTYSDQGTRETVRVAASTTCPPPPEAMEHNVLYRAKHYPPDIQKPGDKIGERTDSSALPYPGQDSKTLIRSASAGIMEMPGQGYGFLSVRAKMLLERKVKETHEHFRVCEGDTVKKEHRTLTCEPGCAARVEASPPTENGSTTTTAYMPPIPTQIGLAEKIELDKDTDQAITGGGLIGEKKARHPGDYQEQTTARWTLTPVDPCEEVRALVDQDQAWAEALLDRALQAQATSASDLIALASADVARHMGWVPGKNVKPGEDDRPKQPENDMQVGSDCKIAKRDAFEEDARAKCKPRILIEALIAHEQRHVEQCQAQKKHEPDLPWGGISTGRYAYDEAEAYLTGAGKALGWYERHCPGDASSLKQKQAALRKKLKTQPGKPGYSSG